jgi:LysR family transcriptional regulator, glycine cleavage system transcriptional activator
MRATLGLFDCSNNRYYTNSFVRTFHMTAPDLESLRCFEAAASHPSFRVAAQTVALSPAAFGERIKRLEDQLGAPLFARTTRRVALTAAGHRLLPQARRALEEAARCREVVHERDTPLLFSLSVGTRFELGLSWLAASLPTLQARTPARTLHLVFGDSPDHLARVRNGLLDCAVTSYRLTSSELTYEVLHDEDYVLVGSARRARRHPFTRSEHAADHALIDISPELPLFRYFLDAQRGRAVWGFSRTEYLGTIGAIRLRVLQGAGIAVLPHYFVAPDLRARRLVRLMPHVALHRDAFRLVWRTGHPRERELRELAAELTAIEIR